MISRHVLNEKEVPLKSDPSRTKVVREFYYTDAQGRRVSGALLAYCQSLPLPPMYDTVAILERERANGLLAECVDSKGRKVHIYSQAHKRLAATEKFARLRKLQESIPELVKELRFDAHRGVQEAEILWMIYVTGYRIGSNRDTGGDVKAYGISTLLSKHVNNVAPWPTTRLDFIGKKGVRLHKTVRDVNVASTVLKRKRAEWSRPLFSCTDSEVRRYLHSLDPRFKVKDLRMWVGTEEAKRWIAKRKGPASSEKQLKTWRNEVADRVAKCLGNTRAVALNSYIDPAVWRKWEGGKWEAFVPKDLREDD